MDVQKMEVVESKNIFEAQAKAMLHVEYVQKERSPELGYSVATEEATLEACRPALLLFGIVMHPIACKILEREEWQSKSKNRMSCVTMEYTWRFTHWPSDTHIDAVVVGEALDTSDKRTPKVLTITRKLAIQSFFTLIRGDDPDKVFKERHSPNHKLYVRAYQAITDAKGIDKLNVIWDRIMQDDFSDEQREDLLELCAEQARSFKVPVDKWPDWMIGKKVSK